MNPSEVRALLARQGLRAQRDLGQNFLTDPRLAAKLVQTAGVAPEEAVVEIGTGLGILTRALAERARAVVSIEVDAGLVRALRAEALLPAGVELIHADALEVDLAALLERLGAPARVVGNLPYSVASPLLRRLLDVRDRVAGWSVMVQREVAERVVATPGGRDYGSFSVLHHLVGRVERGHDLHRMCFEPVPRVASRFVSVVPHEPALLAAGELERVEGLTRAAFAHRRKTLLNSLRAAGGPADAVAAALPQLGVDPRARAEVLPPASWLALARVLEESRGEP